MARRWARVRPHRLSFLLGGDDPEIRLVEEIPAEGFGGRRHVVHVICFDEAARTCLRARRGAVPRRTPCLYSTAFSPFTQRNRRAPWAAVTSFALVPCAVHVRASSSV